MKKISVLLVCFMMLFAFVSCDNGGSSPAETVKTTATEEQIATVQAAVFPVVGYYYDQFNKVGPIEVDEDVPTAVSSSLGVFGHIILDGNANEDGTGAVNVDADLEYQNQTITLEGTISWKLDAMGITPEYDISKLIATIDGATINGKDLLNGLN